MLQTLFIGLIFSELEDKIVNGNLVQNAKQFPLVVSVRLKEKHSCGGYLIAGSHVLTAGHCIAKNYFQKNAKDINDMVSMYSVYVGSINRKSGGNLYSIINMEFHHKLTPWTQGYPYDIALLTVSCKYKLE